MKRTLLILLVPALFVLLTFAQPVAAPCSGTCTTCPTYGAQVTCEAQAGCSWGTTCTGSPLTCVSMPADQAICTAFGCGWNKGTSSCKVGTPTQACSAFDADQTTCEGGGCTFNTLCSGTCTACLTYGAQGTCESQAGCSWTAIVCGNNSTEQGELCDGTDLNSQTCITKGFDGGTLACDTGCQAYDTSLCTTSAVCGDNTAESPEVCDGTDLNSQTCITKGYDSGTLACAGNCLSYNTSNCTTAAVCGNNTTESPELCDGTDLNNGTCTGEGFIGGTLACAGSCLSYDTSSCTGCSTTCNGSCESASCFGTDPDCDASGNATLECCGNKYCEGDNFESCSACPTDCGECPYDEVGGLPPSVCGDGKCTYPENECSCIADCGTCTGLVPNYSCREFQCVGGACQGIFTLGCCGNSKCEDNEDFTSCRTDCPGPKEFIITQVGQQYYLRGDTVNFLFQINADSTKAIGAKVKASGAFGELTLFDNGQHNDRSADDSIFSNQFELGIDVAEGTYPVRLDISMLGTEKMQIFDLNVYPRLDVKFTTDKQRYLLGETIKINGTVARRGTPIESDIEISVSKDSKLIAKSSATSDSKGLFKTSHQISTIDPAGNWTVSVKATGPLNNYADVGKEIEVVEPAMVNFLWIDINPEIIGSFKRGSDLKVIVDVSDIHNEIVSGANVELVASNGNRWTLNEISSGKYSGSYTIPWQLGIGSQKFEVVASKEFAGLSQDGLTSFYIPIEKTTFITEIVEPTRTSFMVGEDIEFKIKLTYSSGEPVTESTVEALINGNLVEMKAISEGLYSVIYYIDDLEMENITFSIAAKDAYENVSNRMVEVEVAGTSPSYYAREFPLSFYLIALSGALLVLMFAITHLESHSLTSLKKKEMELLAQKKNIETEYFKHGTMDRKTYNDMKAKVDPQLEEVRKDVAETEAKLNKRKMTFKVGKK